MKTNVLPNTVDELIDEDRLVPLAITARLFCFDLLLYI